MDDRSVKVTDVSHKHIVAFLTKVLLSPFLFGFCTISGSCKEVYSRSYLRFISFNFASGSMELTVSRLMAKKG